MIKAALISVLMVYSPFTEFPLVPQINDPIYICADTFLQSPRFLGYWNFQRVSIGSCYEL